MPLDPVIASGFRGLELQNPLEVYSRVNQLQQLQQQNQLNALKMDEYQRGLQEQNALRAAIRPDFDPANPAHQAELYRVAPTLAAGVIEKAMMTRKTAGEIAKNDAETRKYQAEAQDKRLRALGVGLVNVIKDPSDAALTQTFDTLDATGVDTKPFRAQFAQIPDVEQRRQIIMNYATSHPEGRAALEFVRPKPQQVDLKDRVAFVDMNPNSPTYGQETRPAASAGRVSQLLTPEEEAQKTRIALASRQPAQPREPAAPTITQIQDPTDPTRTITIDARRYEGGGMGSPGVIGASGKTPKAEADKLKQEQGASQAMDILDTLKTAYGELDRMRAIPSEQRGGLSNVAAGAAATGVGQAAGRLFGTKEQTQRDIIASSRNQLLMALKNATGMSSQQLNSNVELRSWLDALSDPSRSIQANQAILDNVERFIVSGGKYSAKTSGGKVTPAPSSVRSQADAIIRGGR